MEKLRVGFIGTGRISDLHAIEYLNNPRAQLAAVCDADPQIAQARAAAWGVPANRVFSDHRDLLAFATQVLCNLPGDPSPQRVPSEVVGTFRLEGSGFFHVVFSHLFNAGVPRSIPIQSHGSQPIHRLV